MYYSYHNIAKQLINTNHLIGFKVVDKWNNISPALVLFFDNHRPMPIRKDKWERYMENKELKTLKEEIKRRKDIYSEEAKNLGSLTPGGSFVRGKAVAMLDVLYEIKRIESG